MASLAEVRMVGKRSHSLGEIPATAALPASGLVDDGMKITIARDHVDLGNDEHLAKPATADGVEDSRVGRRRFDGHARFQRLAERSFTAALLERLRDDAAN